MYKANRTDSSSGGRVIVIHRHIVVHIRRTVRRPRIAIQRRHGNRVIIRPFDNIVLAPEIISVPKINKFSNTVECIDYNRELVNSFKKSIWLGKDHYE